MFAVVRFEEKEKGIKNVFSKKGIKSQRIFLPNGESFFIITAQKHKGKIPFEKIAEFSGILNKSLIFPESCTVPEEYCFEPKKLKQKMLFQLLVSYLQKNRPDIFSTSLCICDSEGIYAKEIEQLLPFAFKIHIVCERPDLYENTVKHLFSEYGISVTVSENFNSLAKKCSIVLSEDSSQLPLGFYGVLFTLKKGSVPAEKVFTAEVSGMSAEYEKLCPEDISETLFACALYEKCKVDYKEFFLDKGCV